MRFATKIAVVVRDDLAVWQKLNVTAFLALAVAGADPEVIGAPYRDGTGNGYLPMFRQPVFVFAADAAGLRRAHGRALGRGVPVAVFTEELFGTDNDADNRAAVAVVPVEKLMLAGLALHAPRATVDKVLDRLRLHS
jgi:hypothetical protein